MSENPHIDPDYVVRLEALDSSVKRSTMFDLTRQFNKDVKPLPGAAIDSQKIIAEMAEWIEHHKEAILLAWFAEYGFEPGKAVLVYESTMTGTKTFIRESTPEEMEKVRATRERFTKENS